MPTPRFDRERPFLVRAVRRQAALNQPRDSTTSTTADRSDHHDC
jgi:hypothetical protein